MLESWTIQRLIFFSTNEEDNKIEILSMRINSGELKSTPLFRMKTFMDYCPCGCDKYTPKIQIQNDLQVKYYDERIAKEREALSL
jgi:hypothetical protein